MTKTRFVACVLAGWLPIIGPVTLAACTEKAPAPAPATLPTCTTEDGGGTAQCLWYGGGHARAPIVSGDCAPSIMGDATAACLKVYALPERVNTYQDATVVIPAGPALVEECADIRRHSTPRTLQADGWTMLNCLTGWLNN